MTAALTTRDALAKARDHFCDCPGRGLPDDQHAPLPNGCHGLEVVAAVSGAVIDAATLADDEAWQRRIVAASHAVPWGGDEPGDIPGQIEARFFLRALAAALTERGEQHG